jgi:SlyX protein
MARMSSVEQRLEQLETRLAFLEQANSQLSDVIYRQQQAIDGLRDQLRVMSGRLEAGQAQPTAYNLEDEKPPHY